MPVVLLLSKARTMNPPDANSICLECGLCCNGVIFADGQLQPEDDAEKLKSLGLRLLTNRKPQIANRKFHQPCGAFDGGRCNIYCDRPKYCREFECLLLKSVQAGETEVPAALGIIRNARKRVDKVKRLLRELGDADEHVALSKRFRKTQKRIEAGELDHATAQLYGELTLAVHDLNMLLSEAFYPGE